MKTSMEQRKKLITAINDKNVLVTKKIDIINGLQQTIIDHERMVSAKATENEKLFKDVEGLNDKLNLESKDLAKTKIECHCLE